MTHARSPASGRRRGRSAGARLFRRGRRRGGEIPRAAGWPARRRARLQRLGHAHQRGRRSAAGWRHCSARSTAPSPRSRPTWATAWRETVVAVVTEFGRTARINGTEGTDHGTGTVALLVGGALKGGRVIADWPGLKERDLYESRDLKPTTDLRAVLKGVLQGSSARRRARAGGARVPRQQRREADGGFVGLAAWDHLLPRTGCPVIPIRTSISRRDQPVSVARFWASCVKRAGSAAR